MPHPLLALFFIATHRSALTRLYTLSLHDALPIFLLHLGEQLEARHVRQAQIENHAVEAAGAQGRQRRRGDRGPDRKSTRLNASHCQNSYGDFCLKKKASTTGRRRRFLLLAATLDT